MKQRTYSILLVFLFVFSSVFSQENTVENDVFQKINLNFSGLEKVNNYYTKNNKKRALKELLKFYRKKENVFIKVLNEDLNFIKGEYPEDVERSIKVADEVIKNYFVFREEWDMERTNIPYQFKGEIDWKVTANGDSEWTWMLNRHKYWIHLGKAYFFTGKEKYAKVFVKQAEHWIKNNQLPTLENKYRNSTAWRTIEAGIRCENWIKSFELIKNSKHITPDFLQTFLNALHRHGEYINNIYTNFSKTSNWGVLENHGLFNTSVFLKEFKQSSKWKKKSLSRLTECINIQILEDGNHWEQSPMYHNEVLHCFMNVILLSQRNGIELPKSLKQKTKDMSYANIGWQKPNYHQPLLGDSDDTDLRGHLSMASYLFKDPVLKYRAFQNLNYENFFALGKQEYLKYKNIEAKVPGFLSVYHQNTGNFYMRTSWSEDAKYASLHLKRLAAGHEHDNLLHFTLFANNRDYLVDNGRFSYVGSKWRKLFKSSQSHNTLEIDDLPNSIYTNSWANKYQAWSVGAYTKIHANFDYGEAINKAYNRLKDPVNIKRRMLFIKPNVWLIFDSFSAKEKHKYSQYFNFSNKKIAIEDNSVVTTYPSKNLKIKPLKDVEIKIVDSWYSPEYNLKEESKKAVFIKNSKGFTSLITLLYFPKQTKLTYKKVPVYTRGNALLTDKDVEAVSIFIGHKEYTFVVVYNSSTISNHFFKVNDITIHGEVILIEKEGDHVIKHVIKG